VVKYGCIVFMYERIHQSLCTTGCQDLESSPESNRDVDDFRRCLGILRARFVVISALVLLVWTPCGLFSSYMDYFVFDPADIKASYNFSRLLYYLVGVIATAGMVHVALSHSSDGTITVGQAFRAGLRAWPRMAWTQFLTDAFLVLSFVLLVVPCLYLMPRLFLVESVVVCEGLSGNAAIDRSYALTRGHYWKVFQFMLVVTGIMGGWLAFCWFAPAFLSLPDHWLLDVALNLIADVISAYETVLVFCLYRALAQLSDKSYQA